MFSTVPFPRVYGSWERSPFLILFLAFTFLTLSVSEKMWGHFGICYYFLLLLKGLNNMHNVGGAKPAKHNHNDSNNDENESIEMVPHEC